MELLAQAADAGDSRTGETVLFWVFSVLGVGAGFAVITLRNVIHAALMLVVNFASIAVLYLALETAFLSVVQVIVYAGAIMILFLFVIMLLGVDRDDLLVDVRIWHRVGAGLLALAVVGALAFAFVGPFTSAASRCGDAAAAAAGRSGDVPCTGMGAAVEQAENGSVGVLGERLFNRFTFPFEVAALLLTVATIGAIVLGRRGDEPPEAEPDLADAEPPPPAEEDEPAPEVV